MSGAVKSQSRYPNLPGAGWTSEGTSELQCATSSDQLHQDAGGQQYCSEHLAVGHYEWGDHCSHGVVGGESVVGRVGEQGLDQWVDDKGRGSVWMSAASWMSTSAMPSATTLARRRVSECLSEGIYDRACRVD